MRSNWRARVWGWLSPNPYVGAVIADAARNVVGTGSYTYAGVKHAEVLALEAAGKKARGGTLLHQSGTTCASGADSALY